MSSEYNDRRKLTAYFITWLAWVLGFLVAFALMQNVLMAAFIGALFAWMAYGTFLRTTRPEEDM